MSERLARAAWSRIAEPGDQKACAVLDRLGYEAGLEAVREGIVPEAERFAPRVAELDVGRDLALAAAVGGRVVIPSDPDWPEGLTELEHPPHCLWVRGSLTGLRRSVAVVGARAATPYGLLQARELGAGLAGRRWTVVSGAAFGIDAAAHHGALSVPGPTCAVLACGVERAYPRAHAELIEQVCTAGAIITEVPPGAAPTRYRFLQRNRLIAAMTGGTVVVEAAIRSGSLSTARVAASLSRPVGAFPGPVTSMMSGGCHEAVRAGLASLVTDAAEVIDLVGAMGEDAVDEPTAPDTERDLLGVNEARVLGAIPGGRPRTADELAVIAGLSTHEVLAALGALEVEGWVERAGAGYRRRPRKGAWSPGSSVGR